MLPQAFNGGSLLGFAQGRAQPTNPLGIPSGARDFASRTRAALARADWADYLLAYGPMEDELLASVHNPKLRTSAISDARSLAAGQFQANDQAFRRDLASYGVSMTPEQQVSYDRSRGIQRGLADVEAANRTSYAISDRDRQLVAGGLSAGLNSLTGRQA